jgi:hypothetical protein
VFHRLQLPLKLTFIATNDELRVDTSLAETEEEFQNGDSRDTGFTVGHNIERVLSIFEDFVVEGAFFVIFERDDVVMDAKFWHLQIGVPLKHHSLSATENELVNKFIQLKSSCMDTKILKEIYDIGNFVLDRRPRQTPPILSPNSTSLLMELSALVADYVTFVHNNTVPRNLVEYGRLLHIVVVKKHMVTSDSVGPFVGGIGADKEVFGGSTPVGTNVEIDVLFAEDSSHNSFPLGDNGGRDEDKGATDGVPKANPSGLDGLTQSRFIRQNSSASTLGVEFSVQHPGDTVELIGTVELKALEFEVGVHTLHDFRDVIPWARELYLQFGELRSNSESRHSLLEHERIP